MNHGSPPDSVFESSLCLQPSDILLGKPILHTPPPVLPLAASSSEPLRVTLEGRINDVTSGFCSVYAIHYSFPLLMLSCMRL